MSQYGDIEFFVCGVNGCDIENLFSCVQPTSQGFLSETADEVIVFAYNSEENIKGQFVFMFKLTDNDQADDEAEKFITEKYLEPHCTQVGKFLRASAPPPNLDYTKNEFNYLWSVHRTSIRAAGH